MHSKAIERRSGGDQEGPKWQFWLLTAFLGVVFLTGGSSRIDVASLPLLTPVSVLVCAVASLTMRWRFFDGRKTVFALILSLFGLALLHQIPLPPAIWQNLPGRSLLVDVETMAGLSGIWRPVTVTPMNGWHGLFSLFTPLAVVLLALQLGKRDLRRLVFVVMAFGFLSLAIALLQVIGDPNGVFYLYRVTNNGDSVGFFANRNHAAVYFALHFPVIALFISRTVSEKSTQLPMLLSALFILIAVPVILLSGSRAGVIVSVLGLVSMFLLYGKADTSRTAGSSKRKASPLDTLLERKFILYAFVFAVFLLSFLMVYFSRAQSIDRFFENSVVDDARGAYWAASVNLFWKYFPWGSGAGSFVEVFQIDEPSKLLLHTYLNRAHNDWIETGITFGLPGLLLLAAAVLAFAVRSFAIWRPGVRLDGAVAMARMAGICLLMLAIASIADYPLRTPIMMALSALFVVWFTEPRNSDPATRFADPSDQEV